MSDPLTPGIFLDVRIGIACGDLPPDFVLRVEADGEPFDSTVIRCYSTDLNATFHAARNLRMLKEIEGGFEIINYELGQETPALGICAAILIFVSNE